MAYVDVTGTLTDAGGDPIPSILQPRLWAVPMDSTIFGPVLLTDDEVLADLQSNGEFSVRIQSIPDLKYQLWLDRLVPGQEAEPPENRARSWVAWSPPFHPGDGGRIGDLGEQEFVGAMWIGEQPPPGGPSYPVGTRWLDSNASSADYGWIKKWE